MNFGVKRGLIFGVIIGLFLIGLVFATTESFTLTATGCQNGQIKFVGKEINITQSTDVCVTLPNYNDGSSNKYTGMNTSMEQIATAGASLSCTNGWTLKSGQCCKNITDKNYVEFTNVSVADKCFVGSVNSFGSVTYTAASCTVKTCTVKCGNYDPGCGAAILSCGTCPFGQTCNATNDCLYLPSPTITFTSPTPPNGSIGNNISIVIDATMVTNQPGLSTLNYALNNELSNLYDGSLVLMYNFEDKASLGENATYAVDMSRDVNGTNGTIKSGTYATGKYGEAISLTGNGYVSFSPNPSAVNLSGNQQYTLAAWINPNSLGSTQGIIGWGNYGTYNKVNALRLASTGECTGGDGIDNYWWNNNFVQCNTGLKAGTWNYIVTTYDGAMRTIYVNGVKIGNKTVSVTPNFVSSNYKIGLTNTNEYFKGLIDEVRIYNRSLSADEVYILYAGNLQRLSPTSWEFVINQSQNATTKLYSGNYTYTLNVMSNTGATNSSSRTFEISCSANICANKQCGQWTDSCGVQQNCGVCGPTEACNSTGQCIAADMLFGGVYSDNYINPITGGKNCSAGYNATQVYYTKVSSDINDAADCISSGGSVYCYDMKDRATYFCWANASNPSTPKVANFGGMITPCPTNYTQAHFLGETRDYPAPRVDHNAYFCYNNLSTGSLYLFGGMYGGSGRNDKGWYNNPFTGSNSCPDGYTAVRILKDNDIDNSMYYCFAATRACIPECTNPDGTAKVCGNDGCGGTCGTCDEDNGYTCVAGQCQAPHVCNDILTACCNSTTGAQNTMRGCDCTFGNGKILYHGQCTQDHDIILALSQNKDALGQDPTAYNDYPVTINYSRIFGTYYPGDNPHDCTATNLILRLNASTEGSAQAPVVCTPKTCANLGRQCGNADDKCGTTLDCGTCSSGEACNSTGQCVVSSTTIGTTCDDDLVYNATDGNTRFILSDTLSDTTYILKATVVESDGYNRTTIRNMDTGIDVCIDKKAGDLCSIGNAGIVISDVTYNKIDGEKEVYMTRSSNTVFNYLNTCALSGIYAVPICYGNLTCTAKSACTGDEKEVVDLAALTDSLLGIAGTVGYADKICCLPNVVTPPPAVVSYYWAYPANAGQIITNAIEEQTVRLVAKTGVAGAVVNFTIVEDDSPVGKGVITETIRTGLQAKAGADGTVVYDWKITRADLSAANVGGLLEGNVGEFYFIAKENATGAEFGESDYLYISVKQNVSQCNVVFTDPKDSVKRLITYCDNYNHIAGDNETMAKQCNTDCNGASANEKDREIQLLTGQTTANDACSWNGTDCAYTFDLVDCTCNGKQCGDDGCGNSCGTCGSGSTCNTTGQCIINSGTCSCTNKYCGEDGCGHSCGTCPSGSTCYSDQICYPNSEGGGGGGSGLPPGQCSKNVVSSTECDASTGYRTVTSVYKQLKVGTTNYYTHDDWIGYGFGSTTWTCQSTTPVTETIPCETSVQATMPFFTMFNIICAMSAIALVYAFLLFKREFK